MTEELDRTQQRILGVLIEKELTVPESYPLTENAVVAGCNQKSNRDPEMGLEPFQVNGALMAMMTDDWVKTATSMGARTSRYAHRLDAHYAVDEREKAVLCELLVRGPQASGALKPRIARLGFDSNPIEIEQVLRGMAEKVVPMVEQLPKRPRERDYRWRQLLGPMDSSHEAAAAGVAPVSAPVTAPVTPTQPIPRPTPPASEDLEARVARLEQEVAELRAGLDR